MTTLEQRFRREAAQTRAELVRLTPAQARANAASWGRRHVPRSLQAGYIADLTRMQKQINAQIFAALQPTIKLISVRNDANDDDPVSNSIRTIQAGLDRNLTDEAVSTIVIPHGRATQKWNDKKYDNKLGNVLRLNALPPGVDSEMFGGWVRENVSLIKGANSQQIDKIASTLYRAERNGLRADAIEKEIQRILGTTVDRAKLIARDQISKMSGQLDRVKQIDAGIDAYVWRTSQDERVRSSHAALNGRRFTWARPPDVGNPGQPIRCRCIAEPDFGDLLTLS